jgi:hypothetical protein
LRALMIRRRLLNSVMMTVLPTPSCRRRGRSFWCCITCSTRLKSLAVHHARVIASEAKQSILDRITTGGLLRPASAPRSPRNDGDRARRDAILVANVLQGLWVPAFAGTSGDGSIRSQRAADGEQLFAEAPPLRIVERRKHGCCGIREFLLLAGTLSRKVCFRPDLFDRINRTLLA